MFIFLACWYQYCMLNKTLNEECFQIFTIFYKHYARNLCRLLKFLNNPLIVFHATSRIWISGFQKHGKNTFLDATKVEGIPHDECWSMHCKWKWHVSLLDWSIYVFTYGLPSPLLQLITTFDKVISLPSSVTEWEDSMESPSQLMYPEGKRTFLFLSL